MQPHPHIVRLYNRTVRRYRKLTSRLSQHDDPASFSYRTLLGKLKKLRRKIGELQATLRVAVAAGVVVFICTDTRAQQKNPGPFVLQPRHENPLRGPYLFKGNTYPATADLDGDGDYDLIVGAAAYYYDYYGAGPHYKSLRYFVNIGTNQDPVYEEKFDSENPFTPTTTLESNDRQPAFADIDNDGDQDLFVGTGHRIAYFRNDNGTFSEQTGAWNPATQTGNPFHDINAGGSEGQARIAFADIDGDGDLDAFITGELIDPDTGSPRYVSYFQNDGQGSFTDASGLMTFNEIPPASTRLPLALTDFDNDGNHDLLLGDEDTGLLCYKQVSPNVFERQEGSWDPLTGTGNPFDGLHDTSGDEIHIHPAFADLNGDGHTDLLLGGGDGDSPHWNPENTIEYYLNDGSLNFIHQTRLNNPLGGVKVYQTASPALVDIDDDGDLDAIIGHKYTGVSSTGYLELYRLNDDVFQFVEDHESPFSETSLSGTRTPSFGDLNGDGEPDLIIAEAFQHIRYYVNQGGDYVEVTTGNPFEDISLSYWASAYLADLDGDGDLDLAVRDAIGFQFHENIGTPYAPVFEQRSGDDNPLDGLSAYNFVALHFADVDHDGDLDLLFSQSTSFDPGGYGHQIGYYENAGDARTPTFTHADVQPFLLDWTTYHERYQLQPYLVDYDGDGDLDVFIGNYGGTVEFMINDNPPPTVGIQTTPLKYVVDKDDPVLIDPLLIVSEDDDDNIAVRATVTILNADPDDLLTFDPQGNISGAYDESMGTLTLSGEDTYAAYEAVLRTVAYRKTSDMGTRRRTPQAVTVTKQIDVRVYDVDFTTPPPAVRELQVITNTPPTVNATTVTLHAGGIATVDILPLISDVDENVDLSTLTIGQQPASGATVTLNADHQLMVDYTGLPFTGQEQIEIGVCDSFGACGQGIVTITVSNSPPVIVGDPLDPPAGDIKTINLLEITSDPDGNLNPEAFTIVTQPISGAHARIEVSNGMVQLTIDYTGVVFNGVDELRIRSCDYAGACTEQLLEVPIETTRDIRVYNAVAPNSAGDNRYMRIVNLPEQNRVSIFSRWGDLVFEVDQYDDALPGKRFEGLNNSGNTLASGTYFYKIEAVMPGGARKEVTGHLELKQ